MRNSASIILLVFIAFFATSPACGDSHVRIFSRDILLPDDCLFHPNTHDVSHFGNWNCGVSSLDKPGGSIYLIEKHAAEKEDLWRPGGRVVQVKFLSGDTHIRRLEAFWKDRKWQVAYMCDETHCLKILSLSARFLDRFFAQFEEGNTQSSN